jgi:hypothetical protein
MSNAFLRGPVGAVLLMVVALAGVTGHLGVWLHAKRHADSLNTPVFEANAAVSDARASCERQKAGSADTAPLWSDAVEGRAEVARADVESCAAVADVTARRDTLVSERQQRRQAAWETVPPMLVWPVAGVFGLLRYVRLTRR